jgi:hypothetical protein
MRSVRALAILFASLSAVAAAPAIASEYDGLWNVTIYTKNGTCDPTLTVPVNIVDGKVSAAQGLSGSVNSSGMVRVSINGAQANGTMSGKTASGKWNGASGGIACSGRWEAAKQ